MKLLFSVQTDEGAVSLYHDVSIFNHQIYFVTLYSVWNVDDGTKSSEDVYGTGVSWEEAFYNAALRWSSIKGDEAFNPFRYAKTVYIEYMNQDKVMNIRLHVAYIILLPLISTLITYFFGVTYGVIFVIFSSFISTIFLMDIDKRDKIIWKLLKKEC